VLGGGGAAAPVASLTFEATGADTLTLQRITPTGGDTTVSWGDGDETTISDGNTGSTAHTYAGAGTYEVTFSNPGLITYFTVRLDAKITALDVTECSSLTTLNCTNNNIGVLDVSSLTSLTYLNCANNSIGVLDVSALTSLTFLRCPNNNISVLDVSSLTSLTTLICGNNNISVLDVSALTSLTYLQCVDNSISVLDVSALTSLTYLQCVDNSISVLDVSSLANGLYYLDASDNGMAQSAVDTIITDIWDRRADWTDATPELDVGGTNSTPTGAYQDGYPTPLDELEMVHDLINDDDAAGIQTWAAITWNGGSAP
jgi:hypothetical protein